MSLIWLRLKVGGDLLRAHQWAFGLHKMQGFLDWPSNCWLFKEDSGRWSWLLGTLEAKHIFESSSFQKTRLWCCVPYVRSVPRIASQSECVDPFKSLFSLAFPLWTNALVLRQAVAPWVWSCCGRWRLFCALLPHVTRLHCVRKHRTDHSQFRFLYVPIFIKSSAFQMIETRSTIVYFDNCDSHTGLDVLSWVALEAKAARSSETLAPIYKSARRHFTWKTDYECVNITLRCIRPAIFTVKKQ
jgi:hypothetical protein